MASWGAIYALSPEGEPRADSPTSETPQSQIKIIPKTDSSRWLKPRVEASPEVGLAKGRKPYKGDSGGNAGLTEAQA